MCVDSQANPFSSISILCSIILILTFFTTPSLSVPKKTSTPSTAYDFLQQNNLPRGLLPRGAKSFRYDSSSGKFTIKLNNTCRYSKTEFLKVKYNPTITGTIGKNIITSLGGVKVKLVFVWVNVRSVSRNSEELIFIAGLLPIPVPAPLFRITPPCLD
ncbi:unnamed protein product [Lupinus luteus]|uniref:Uncharacterized protein n=1 Tax=Lupinus luteus TaxID=3873 RepID=A0AAV1WME8_LUPLU